MKKKFLTVVACVLLVVILAVTLTACNKYEWNYIGGGDSSADVLSNGGYAVQQGNYVYFVNGYTSTTADNNEWGSTYKQGIWRATLDASGNLVADSYQWVVPKLIYSADTKSGIAVFGEWIYYATPNVDKDKTGTASTTNLDFMRTKIDGSVTQKIYTLSKRDYPYIFTPSRILYYDSTATTIYAIDFSGMKTNKSVTDGKGSYRTELVTGVTSYAWQYDDVRTANQGLVASDYILYTCATSDTAQSYRNCNELNVIKYDGSGKQTVAKFDTYTVDTKLSLLAAVAESDTCYTVYYTKSVLVGTTATVIGVYMNKLETTSDMAFNVANEKKLTSKSQTTLLPINYATGALVQDTTDSFYYYLDGTKADEDKYVAANRVIGKASISVHFIDNVDGKWYVYYSASSTATSLFRINLIGDEGDSSNETAVVTAGTIKLDWTKLDMIKSSARTDFYFFNTTDYTYLHRANLKSFTGTEITSSELIGKFTDTDQKTKDDAAAKA